MVDVPAATVLRIGSRGADVLAWQKHLNAAGFKVAEDGVFGPKTATVTMKYQKASGVRPDGKVGLITQSAALPMPRLRPPDPSAPIIPVQSAPLPPMVPQAAAPLPAPPQPIPQQAPAGPQPTPPPIVPAPAGMPGPAAIPSSAGALPPTAPTGAGFRQPMPPMMAPGMGGAAPTSVPQPISRDMPPVQFSPGASSGPPAPPPMPPAGAMPGPQFSPGSATAGMPPNRPSVMDQMMQTDQPPVDIAGTYGAAGVAQGDRYPNVRAMQTELEQGRRKRDVADLQAKLDEAARLHRLVAGSGSPAETGIPVAADSAPVVPPGVSMPDTATPPPSAFGAVVGPADQPQASLADVRRRLTAELLAKQRAKSPLQAGFALPPIDALTERLRRLGIVQ